MKLSDETIRLILREISRNISRERKRRGMSMAQLADAANLSVSHISKMERTKCEIGLKALLKIAMALEMEAADFLPAHLLEERGRKIQTNGERFETITEGSDAQEVEFLLGVSAYMMKELQGSFSFRKKIS